MSLIDKRFSSTGSNEKSTYPYNISKRNFTENIRISAYSRGHFFTKMTDLMCGWRHFFTKMPLTALCKNRYL